MLSLLGDNILPAPWLSSVFVKCRAMAGLLVRVYHPVLQAAKVLAAGEHEQPLYGVVLDRSEKG